MPHNSAAPVGARDLRGIVITVASSKGGVGKTQICQSLSGRLAEIGYKVAVVDIDPSLAFSSWHALYSEQGRKPITLASSVPERDIFKTTDSLAERHDVVLLDTAGFGASNVIFAIGSADYVVIPTQTSAKDLVEAEDMVGKVRSSARMANREIDYRILLNRVKPGTRVLAHSLSELERQEHPRLRTMLSDLTAFCESSFSGMVPRGDLASGQIDRLIDELIEIGWIPDRPAEELAEAS